MKKTIVYITLLAMASMTGCSSSISAIKKDTSAEDMKAMSIKSDEDLNAIQSVIKIPISRKMKYFEVSEPNAFKVNKSIYFSCERMEFKKAIRAISKELGVNIIFDYENKVTANLKGNASGSVSGDGSSTPNAFTGTGQAGMQAQASLQVSGQKDYGTRIDYYNRTITLDYKGPVKELFNYLSESTGYFYTFQNNSLIVKQRQTFSIIIPNFPGIIKEIGNSLEKLGASDVSFDEITNNITFTADYPAYKRVTDFSNDIRNNMALVTMRIIILNVKLNGEENYGIDWSKLVFGYQGQMSPQPFGIPAISSSSAASNSSSGGSTSTSTGAADTISTAATSVVTGTVQDGIGAIMNSTGANIFVQGAKFTLGTFISFIQNYGKSSIIQNVYVQTLSGKKGKLSAVTETPYVSSVGISALSNNTASTSSSATTATAKNGVELEILPSYSKDEGTLTVALNVGLYGVTRFLTLQAGTLGSFNQPETTKKTVEAILRMSPSQTAIIGGLVFEQKNGTTTGLPGDSYLTNSVQTVNQKEELVILVKPQVFEFVAQDI